MSRFDPASATIGGALIGLSALWGFVLENRVTGISGELYNAFHPQILSFPSILFLSGILLSGAFRGFAPFSTTSPPNLDVLINIPLSRVLVGGLLIGFGAGLGNGCTSGHGVCGLVRLSQRSFVAVLIFMATAIITASLQRSSHWFQNSFMVKKRKNVAFRAPANIFRILLLCILPPVMSQVPVLKHTLMYVSRGLLFGAGLAVSGMSNPEKTLGFLDFTRFSSNTWDPSMLCVFMGALPLSYIGFTLGPQIGSNGNDFCSAVTGKDVDVKLIVGASLFGVGWGIIGMCPGPAVLYCGATRGSLRANCVFAIMLVGIFAGKSLLNA